MGGGYHGGFEFTKGAAAGSANFMGPEDKFLNNIRKRKDVDPSGKFDVTAHGTNNFIFVQHQGAQVAVNSRTAARLICSTPGYKRGQSIRLLSCNTGANPSGFAQDLANKLNAIVYAPNNYLWAWPNGAYRVAGAKQNENSHEGLVIDLRKPGKFVKYTPGGNKR